MPFRLGAGSKTTDFISIVILPLATNIEVYVYLSMLDQRKTFRFVYMDYENTKPMR